MNIDNLTLGEIKQLQALFITQSNQPQPHPFIGRYVICRGHSAGVHAGVLVCLEGENAILKDSRRLWSWKVKEGVALSGAAQHGLAQGGRLDVINPEIALTGVCEVIPCTDEARKSIIEYVNK